MNARQACDAILKAARDGENRRCRLLLCALCRLADIHPTLIDAAERFADGELPVGEFTAAFRKSMPSWNAEMDFLGLRLGSSRLDASWLDVLWAAARRSVPESTFLWLAKDVVIDRVQPSMWRSTSQARCLARAAYEGRQSDGAFDPVRLSVLADCLEDDDCPHEVIILHLRGRGVRTCPSCGGGSDHYAPLPPPVAVGTGGDVAGILVHSADPSLKSGTVLARRPCRRCNGKGTVTVPLIVASPHGVSLPAPHYRGCWAVESVLVE